MNMGTSVTVTNSLPKPLAQALPVSMVSSEVSYALIISTSFMAGTGLKKCMPRNFSGR